MKGMNWRRWILFLILCSGLFLNSCSDSNEPEPRKYTYFVSSESKPGISAQDVKTGIMMAQKVIPQVGPFAQMVKNDINIQKIIYTTPFQGQNIKASGLVYMPAQGGNYPVICFQNGTNTEHSKAPSVSAYSELLFMLQSVASMGYIVVIPDYIGFGESQQLPHPYLHGESTIQSILSMLRAVNEFTEGENTAAKPTRDLFIFGYSQGGWATMLLQKEIETRHASEFNLVASVCAAGPYSLEYMNEYILNLAEYPTPYFLASLINAYTTIGLVANPLTDFIPEPYASQIPGLFDGKHSATSINEALTTRLSELLTSDYKNNYAVSTKFATFKSALSANSVKVANWQIATPTRLYHGEEDQIIPVSLSHKIMQDLKNAGTSDSKLQLITLPGVGHTDGVMPVGVQTILWFCEMNGK